MLTSTVNHASDSTGKKQTASPLTLVTTGIQHEPVLLSPGKWSIGSALSNRIVLNDENIAHNQFLIIVTEYRSIIKDWSGGGKWNGEPFDTAILSDGDVIQIAHIQLTVRHAKSQDLISQLPFFAESENTETSSPAGTDTSITTEQHDPASDTSSPDDRSTPEQSTTPYADEVTTPNEVSDRLDRMVGRIKSTMDYDRSQSTECTQPIFSQFTDNGDTDISSGSPETHETDVSEESLSPNVPATEFALEIDQDLSKLDELRPATPPVTESVIQSRDEAVKRLDDLILAANGLSESNNFTTDSTETQLDSLGQGAADAELDDVDRDASIGEPDSFINDTVSNESDVEVHESESKSASRESTHDVRRDQPIEPEANQWSVVSELQSSAPESDDSSSVENDMSACDLLQGLQTSTDFNETGDEIVDEHQVALTNDSDTTEQFESIEQRDTVEEADVEDALSLLGSRFNEVVESSVSDDTATPVPTGSHPSNETFPNSATTDESRLQPTSTESDPRANSQPSWFDSTFMAVDDTSSGVSEAVTDLEVAEQSNEVRADSNNNPDDEATKDLRKQLVEMFDLPSLSENSKPAEPDISIDERIRQIRRDAQSENNSKSEGSESTPSRYSSDSMNSQDDAQAYGESDVSSDSPAEPDLDYGSETLDQFPTSQNQEVTESSDGTEPSDADQASQQDDEESISAYMERLLARNRKATGASPAPLEDSSFESVPVVADNTTSDVKENVDRPAEPETWIDDTPRHQQNRDQVRAEVDIFRQIANQSARSAVATASRRNVRRQVFVKLIASALSLGSGVAALLLNVSLIFGLVVVAIGMFFTVDLTLTILRNLMQRRDIKKSVATINRKSDADNGDSPGNKSATPAA